MTLTSHAFDPGAECVHPPGSVWLAGVRAPACPSGRWRGTTTVMQNQMWYHSSLRKQRQLAAPVAVAACAIPGAAQRRRQVQQQPRGAAGCRSVVGGTAGRGRAAGRASAAHSTAGRRASCCPGGRRRTNARVSAQGMAVSTSYYPCYRSHRYSRGSRYGLSGDRRRLLEVELGGSMAECADAGQAATRNRVQATVCC